MKNKILFTAMLVFALLSSEKTFSQPWSLPGNGNATATSILGSTTAGVPLNLWAGNAQRMTILGTNGFVGIGITAPNNLLDVNGGDIDVNTPARGYMIGDQFVLRHKGDVNNIFVGVNAGFFNTTGTRNTFLGNASGFANDGASYNTFLGYRSGLTNTGVGGFGFQNSFIGSQSGMSNTTGYKNTFIGYNSGFSNKDGRDNVYVGNQSGFAGNVLTLVNENTFVGNQSGQNNQGSQHTFIGFQAGFTQSTQGVVGNTFVGFQSGFSNVGGGENAFLGYKSGYTNTASTNTFIGFRCGELNNSGGANAFLGAFAGNSNVSGSSDVFLGDDAGRLNTTGSNNTFTGTSSGRSNTSGMSNTFNGYVAGFSNTNGVKNTFIGDSAGYSNVGGINFDGSFNTFVGYVAGALNTNGRGNTFTGDSSGYFNNGSFNTFNGLRSGLKNSTGAGNSFYGKESGYSNTIGFYNVYVGSHCGIGADVGNQNTAIGTYAANYNKLGNNNIFAGFESGFNTGVVAPDDNNVAVGMRSGYNQHGTNNTFLGAFADFPIVQTLTNAAAIGANAKVKSNNKMILGDTTVWVGIGVSNDVSPTLGPGNSLEINARTNTTGAIIPNTSGLRFRQLTEVSPFINNNATNTVLSVNQFGDVILVKDNGGTGLGFGGVCGSSPPAMTSNFEIPLSTFNFVFSGQNTTGSRVGIGTSCTPAAKLEVIQNSGATATKGILVTNNDPSTSPVGGSSIGIKSIMPLPTDFNRIAGWFETPVNVFGLGTAIYVPQSGGTVTLGFPNLPYTGNTLQVNGGIFCDVINFPSDASLKTNIQTVNNATSIVKRMRGVSFQWQLSAIGDTTMNGIHYGFIAQEMDSILPNVVRTNMDGLKSIAYTEIIPYVVMAFQEEHKRNDSLASKLDSIQQIVAILQSQMNSCCSSNSRTQNPNTNPTVNQTNVTLDNSQNIVLNQNVPNPFAEQTTITYNLPESVQKAQLLFYDATGKLIKSADLTDRGKGQINVFANDLSNGIYSYALVVDGQIADTKRMVKTQ